MHQYCPRITDDTGHEVYFKREITGVDQNQNIVFERRLKPVVRREVHYMNGRPTVQHRPDLEFETVPVKKTTVTTRYSDKPTPTRSFYFGDKLKFRTLEELNAKGRKQHGAEEKHFHEDIRPFRF